ncbi:uncharacterized protein PAC_04829 [Phialocephala subalpina]|uniref:Heterokaryon incompatibility domain-containing protein n=1 Tax=Phialocephala subalpina TaxID=576137 RepID=A0A1L7WQ95_9HELO|nr:uncharacterized protein PAC_04829 [Phialocephala subalpina]
MADLLGGFVALGLRGNQPPEAKYSKDHLKPESIDEQRVGIPTVVGDARRGVFEFAQNIQGITYQNKTFSIDADKEIRILKLLSSSDVKTLIGLDIPDDLICCELIRVNFQAEDKLKKQPRDLPIIVFPGSWKTRTEGHDLFKLLSSPPLFAALRALRKRGTSFVWIDQLCINQDAEDPEMGRQMGRIDEIYTRAEQTLIWLGVQDEHTQNLHIFLASFLEQQKEQLSDWVKEKSDIRENFFTVRTVPEREAVIKFLNREWFSRVWIFQEAVLSTKLGILCVDLDFSFDDVIKLANAVFQAENSVGGYARSLMKTTLGYNTLDLIKHAKGNCDCRPKCALSEKLQPGRLLEMLLIVLQHLRVTKKQDLINAFLGVVFKELLEGHQERLSAYPSDKSVEAWKLAAKHIIKTTKSPDILAAASGDSGMSDLASWVPDWSWCFQFASPITPPEFHTSFKASGNRCWGVDTDKVDLERNELHVRGIVVDSISGFSNHTIQHYFMLPLPRQNVRILRLHEQVNWVTDKLSSAAQAPSRPGEELTHAVLRTLLADGAFGDQQPIDMHIHDLVDIYDLDDEIEKKDRQNSEDRIMLNKLRQWGFVTQKKGLFLTRKNLLGLAALTGSGPNFLGAREDD